MPDLTKINERSAAEESRRRVIIATCVAFVVGGLSIVAIIVQLTDRYAQFAKDRQKPATTAAEFYETGVQYKSQGWVERSRQALETAIKKDDGSGVVRNQAEQFLRTRLPNKAVSADAEQQNIQAYNAEATGNTKEAKRIWLEMTQKYPDFEWPYGNLAAVYLEEGDAAAAHQLADKVLAKNPHYYNGIMVLARSQMASKDDVAAEATLKRALEEIPDDSEATMLYRRVAARARRAQSR